jgi:glycosidase
MQWDASDDAGFGSSESWLPFTLDKKTVNVVSELDDPDSMLNLYRRILAMRRESKALQSGSYLSRQVENPNVLAYRREVENERVTIALNMSDSWAKAQVGQGTIRISTADHARSDVVNGEVDLAPREGVVIINR